MKRFLMLLMALLICAGSASAEQPALAGKEAVLYCAENGQVLLEKEMDKPAHPASITKLMTALLVLESGKDLSETVTVSAEAVHSIERNSTHIALDTGEQVTLEQMMYAMLLTSANDAANVLAEAVDGTQEAFAEHMTARAEELGCRHTHFTNAHGLDDPLANDAANVLAEAVDGTQEAFAEHMTARAEELGCRHTHFTNAHGLDDPLHYSTAYDMARIMCALLEYEDFLKIAGTQVYHMPPTNKQPEAREFWNKQNLLNPQSKFYDETAIAGKNGYTSQSGHTLVTAARRDGVTLIAVTMGSTESKYDKHRDTRAMFKYGYGQFEKAELSAAQIAVGAEQAGFQPNRDEIAPIMVLLPKGQDADSLTFSEQDGALDVGGLVTVEIPELEAEENVPAFEVDLERETEGRAAKTGLPPMLKWVGAVLLILIILFILLLTYRTVRIRRQRRRIREMRARHRREGRR